MGKTTGGWSFPAGNLDGPSRGMIWTGLEPPTKADYAFIESKLGKKPKIDERSLVGKYAPDYMEKPNWKQKNIYILQELYKSGAAKTGDEYSTKYQKPTDDPIHYKTVNGDDRFGYVIGGVYTIWTDPTNLDNVVIQEGDAQGNTAYTMDDRGIVVPLKETEIVTTSEEVELPESIPVQKPVQAKPKPKSVPVTPVKTVKSFSMGTQEYVVIGCAAAVLALVAWAWL